MYHWIEDQEGLVVRHLHLLSTKSQEEYNKLSQREQGQIVNQVALAATHDKTLLDLEQSIGPHPKNAEGMERMKQGNLSPHTFVSTEFTLTSCAPPATANLLCVRK